MTQQSDPISIIALEIGSSKIRVALGHIATGTPLSVVAVEEEPLPADTVRYGVVRNVEKVAGAIDRLLSRLDSRTAPRHPVALYVAIGGRSLSSSERCVERQLPEEMEITRRLIGELELEARSIGPAALPGVDDVIETLPRSFTIDGLTTSQPEGEVGREVTACFVMLSAQEKLRKNIERVVVEKLGLSIAGYITRPLAIADFVMSPEEKRLGAMFLDFGAETTTVAFYKGGNLQFLSTLPIGSRLITRDIMSLHYLEEQAESLKRNGGHCAPKASEPIIVGGVDFKDINNYVAARASEIIANIRAQITQAGLSASDLPAGIIIVGGGAKLHGFNERMAEETKMKVRAGIPASTVRILDSSIAPGERMDVIACLTKAAEAPTECLSPAPQPVEDEVEEEVIEEPKAAPQKEKKKKPASPKPSFWDKAKKHITDLMAGNEGEDYFDDEYRDDE
ncbi:MAG: rod shape-determining protein [Pseudoflavonifractor sp.]|nr:rod shape-determining protein [Alloprevotella sp.]MCM1117430.1 rod shape-determining protein [Pseudoflavonifractor sp.]